MPDLISGEVNLGEGKGITCRLLGNTGGNISSRSTLWQDTPQTPSTVEAVDVNGDGIPDVVTVNESGSVSVWINLTPKGASNLILGPRVDIQLPGTPSVGLGIGDLNQDGLTDLVIGHTFGTTAWFLMNQTERGKDTAQFLLVEVPVSTSLWVGSPVVVDINGDGRLDVAFALGSYDPSLPTMVSVFMNQTPPGVFQPVFSSPVNILTPSYGTAMAAGDMDGDGRPDLVLASGSASRLTILRNLTASGGLASFDAPFIMDLPFGPRYLVVADINKDGKLDIITSDMGCDAVTVLENRSVPGAFHFDDPLHWNAFRASAGIRVADIDHDGWPDVVIANNEQSTIGLIRNLGVKGNRVLLDSTLAIPAGQWPVAMETLDANKDGHPTVFVTDQGGSAINLIHFSGLDAAGTPIVALSSIPLNVQQPQGLALADLDGDGAPDLATLSVLDKCLVISRNITPAGSSTPQFAPPIQIPWPILWPFGNGWTDISSYCNPILRAMDVNRDGRMDLLAVCEADSSITVFLNLPNGFVAKRFQAPTGARLWHADSMSWGGDASAALMLTGRFFVNQTTTGSADPAFSFSQEFYGSSTTGVRTPMDLDGNGKPDLLFASEGALGGVQLLNTDLLVPSCQWLPWSTLLSTRSGESILVDEILGPGTLSAMVLDGDGYATFYRDFWNGLHNKNTADNVQIDIASGGSIYNLRTPSSQNIRAVRVGTSTRKSILVLHYAQGKLSFMPIIE